MRWDDARAAKAVRAPAGRGARGRQAVPPPLAAGGRPTIADFAELLREPRAWPWPTATGAPPSLARPLVLVGPEGGWAPEERAAAAAAGAPGVALGAHVLRAETAAVTVGAILTGLRAGLLGEISPR